MSAKRTVLESLTRKRLIELAYDFEADFGPTGLSKDELVDEMARLRRTKLEELLPCLSRNELKTACEWLDLDSSGRQKQVIIDRILGSEDGQAGGGSPSQRLSLSQGGLHNAARSSPSRTDDRDANAGNQMFEQAFKNIDDVLWKEAVALPSWTTPSRRRGCSS